MTAITERDIEAARGRYEGEELAATGRQVYAALNAGSAVEFEWEPGDMTRYGMVLVPVGRSSEHVHAPGGRVLQEARSEIHYDMAAVPVVLTIVNFDLVMMFRLGEEIHYTQVVHASSGKVGHRPSISLGSAIAVEQFVNAIAKARVG